MNDFYGMNTDGGVCLWGGVIEDFAKLAGDKWPWKYKRTSGDTRVAVAWPTNQPFAEGCLAVGVLAAGGSLWLPVCERFKSASSHFGDVIIEGLSAKLAHIRTFGVQMFYAQCDNAEQAQIWGEMVNKDKALCGAPVSFRPIFDVNQALEVLREMSPRIKMTPKTLGEIVSSNERGKVTPVAVAVAMLAMGYKMDLART